MVICSGPGTRQILGVPVEMAQVRLVAEPRKLFELAPTLPSHPLVPSSKYNPEIWFWFTHNGFWQCTIFCLLPFLLKNSTTPDTSTENQNQGSQETTTTIKPAIKTTTETTAKPLKPGLKACRSRGLWAKVKGMSDWCNKNCNHTPQFCPKTHCTCTTDNSISLSKSLSLRNRKQGKRRRPFWIRRKRLRISVKQNRP